MKIYSRVTCLVSVIGVLLAGCADVTSTAQTVETVAVPSATVISPPPSATQPLPSPTTQPPTETQTLPSPTLPQPTDTIPPTAVPATPVSSPIPASAILPVEGVWGGGGTNLLLDFDVQISDGQATISNFGILWMGRRECELNVRLDVLVPLDESGFEMNYQADEFSVAMLGAPTSNSVITGVVNIKVEDCGSHQVNWRAVHKVGAEE
jgi:hypothetical protein